MFALLVYMPIFIKVGGKKGEPLKFVLFSVSEAFSSI